MKIDSLNLRPARPAGKPAKTNLIPQSPIAAQKPIVQVKPMKQAIASPDRLRSQRVLLRIRASVHVALKGEATTIDVATLSVNRQGAVVVMKQGLPAETHLVLEHSGTKQRIACKVVRPPRQMPEGFHVPLEFDTPAPDFWKIDFPAADWRPDDV